MEALALEASQLREGFERFQRRQRLANEAAARRVRRTLIAAAALLAVVAIGVTAILSGRDRPTGDRAAGTGPTAPPSQAAACSNVTVVTASSFAPVIRKLASGLAGATPCVRADVRVADGRSASAVVERVKADVWIPDDLAWQATAAAGLIADPVGGQSPTILATSPLYLLTDPATGRRIQDAGSSWVKLAQLAGTASSRISLVMRDPEGSGDGLIAAGSVGEGVWLHDGMEASALALSHAFTRARTVSSIGPALPLRAGEVGLVPEYSLLGRLQQLVPRTVVLAPRDHTALLRVGWLPTARGLADPSTSRALDRLRSTLTGAPGAAALAAAGFRKPGGGPPSGMAAGQLPTTPAKPFDVLAAHHVDHVFATWYPADRRANVLIVVDVSGSMARWPPDSSTAVINVVREGCRSVGALLPQDATLGLWEFGSRLDGRNDYLVLLPSGSLTSRRHEQLNGALTRLRATRTNTGLYDTILAAYTSIVRTAVPGVPNQLLVFTDGRNEGDPDSISAATLNRRLAAAARKQPPTELTVLDFGTAGDAEKVAAAVSSVDGYIHPARSALDVQAAFVHLAAGGLHAE